MLDVDVEIACCRRAREELVGLALYVYDTSARVHTCHTCYMIGRTHVCTNEYIHDVHIYVRIDKVFGAAHVHKSMYGYVVNGSGRERLQEPPTCRRVCRRSGQLTCAR